MRRFFAENLDLEGNTVLLTGDNARHIRNVLRMKSGDEVLLINGGGDECLARILSCREDGVELEIVERQVCEADPDIEVTLFQCLPKQGKMEVIIQKCVELGVSRIVPTVSRRCVVKIEGKDGKIVRWNKVSQEAAKQCGRARVPEVTRPIELPQADLTGFDLVLIAYENESETTLKSILSTNRSVRSIAVIIGPEGGFEPGEVSKVIDAGGTAVSLGRRILRTETAGMAVLAQIMYELEQ
ncbi:MAG: 16S rRNA (uracil(1498)-N(3))-methyltransferase [Clostridiales bacterium]|nr:16S rRNA (uracil(1498)-N(3))-methyltransferase [Clostridiales bacterium]